jgi:hypothetical protein
MVMDKKLIYTLSLVSLLLLSSIKLIGQDLDKPEPETKLKHAIGGGAGFTTGYGLSYRFMPGKFGGQLNFAPFQDKETSNYSAGLTLIYMLIESKISNLFLYQGNHFYYRSYLNYIYNPNSPYQSTKVITTEQYFNNGLGFGIELIIAKRIGLNLMGGYAFYNDFEKLNLTGEIGLYYKF